MFGTLKWKLEGYTGAGTDTACMWKGAGSYKVQTDIYIGQDYEAGGRPRLVFTLYPGGAEGSLNVEQGTLAKDCLFGTAEHQLARVYYFDHGPLGSRSDWTAQAQSSPRVTHVELEVTVKRLRKT